MKSDIAKQEIFTCICITNPERNETQFVYQQKKIKINSENDCVVCVICVCVCVRVDK